MTTRSSKAEWEGDLKTGKGTMTVGKGAYTGPFSFVSRFEEGPGTNPEELIAAAHAGCFSMAFSNGLAKEGFAPKKISTRADVHLGPDPAGGAHITKIELFSEVEAPGIAEAKFQELAEATRVGCPISKLLGKGAEIVVTATLKS